MSGFTSKNMKNRLSLRRHRCLFPLVFFLLLAIPCTGKDRSAVQKVWSECPIIDIHAHIGKFKGFDLSASTLESNVERYGIALALVSNIDGAELPGTTQNLSEQQANEVTDRFVREHKRFRGLLWARPEDGSVAKLEPFLSLKDAEGLPTFVGIKFHPEFNKFGADDPRVDPYLSLCERYKIPAVFHCGSDGCGSSAKRIYAVARRHKQVPIVLYHMGFGSNHTEAIEAVRNAKQSGDAQLYLEVAQAEPDAVLKAVEKVGSGYVLFGTDATYFGEHHYAHYEPLLLRLHAALSAVEFKQIVTANAAKLFKLPARLLNDSTTEKKRY